MLIHLVVHISLVGVLSQEFYVLICMVYIVASTLFSHVHLGSVAIFLVVLCVPHWIGFCSSALFSFLSNLCFHIPYPCLCSYYFCGCCDWGPQYAFQVGAEYYLFLLFWHWLESMFQLNMLRLGWCMSVPASILQIFLLCWIPSFLPGWICFLLLICHSEVLIFFSIVQGTLAKFE